MVFGEKQGEDVTNVILALDEEKQTKQPRSMARLALNLLDCMTRQDWGILVTSLVIFYFYNLLLVTSIQQTVGRQQTNY